MLSSKNKTKQKLKLSKAAKYWWIPNKSFTIIKPWCSFINDGSYHAAAIKAGELQSFES